jgi:hypothetical protein
MRMVVGLPFMAGMIMLVGAVLAAMPVIVDMIVGPMVVFMAVFVVMGVVMGVAVLMAVGLPVVGVFVRMGMLMFVRVVMLMGVFAFHCVVLLSYAAFKWLSPLVVNRCTVLLIFDPLSPPLEAKAPKKFYRCRVP